MTGSDIESKVVAITGASSGIGEAAARHLAQRGAKVVLGARRTDNLERIVREIEVEGGAARHCKLDVTQRKEMQDFVDFTVREFGRVDVMLNNAGVMPLSMLEALKVEEWDRMIDVNIRGVLYGIAAALPHMRAQGSGQFVNVSSIGAHMVLPTAAVYCATKHAVNAISEGLRQEHSDIQVSVISPGVTESELAESISDPEMRRSFIEGYRHTALSAEAIARVIAFAIEQPIDVDVNEIIVRLTATQDWSEVSHSATDHPYIGMWVTEDGHIRHELLPNNRYAEARGDHERAYEGRYEVTGSHIDYWDDTGFTADGDFRDGVLYHAGMVLKREGEW